MHINDKNLTKLKAMKRHSMSQFNDRVILLYRSFDQDLVKTYHGDRKYPGFYEILMMDYAWGEPQYLIKFPYTDFFVELSGSGSSINGVHEHISCSNPIGDIIDPYFYQEKLQPEKIEIYRFGERIMIKTNSFRHDFLDQIEDANISDQEYVKIPELREISYAFYSPQYQKYLIVDHSEFNFQYNTMRLFFGDLTTGMKTPKIENFVRYRDGGTTLFEFDYEGERYKFHSPTKLGSVEKKHTTLNDSVIFELVEIEKERFLRDLNIPHINKKEIKEDGNN
jgi:hypothetical protein